MNEDANYTDLFYSGIDNNIDTLEKNVKEFPCSSLARFLLLYHYKKNNNPGFEQLARQTGVYINNPIWVQYQLSKTDTGHFSKENKEDSLKLEKQNQQTEENISPEVEEQINQIPVSEVAEEERKEDFYQIETTEENISPAVEEQIDQIPVSENEVAEEERKEDFFESEKQIETIQETISPAVEEQISPIYVLGNDDVEEERKEDFYQSETQIETTQEDISPAVQEQISRFPVSENEVAEEEKKEDFFESEKQIETVEANTSPAVEGRLNEPFGQEQISPISVLGNDDVEKERNEENSNKIEEKDEELIAFEPLHTVDYFASQGIKISEEELENDHLGKQVKSFTAWLKSMKKLHPGQLPEQNEVIEKIIQASAETSNQNANVLTEAMAEVLIKQDKKEKAIEMYQKLSLMNPSKSAYFAAKIESLKII